MPHLSLLTLSLLMLTACTIPALPWYADMWQLVGLCLSSSVQRGGVSTAP